MCSRTRGPAISPSFVTCPTSTTTKPRRLARPINSCAAPRTWLTVPGALSSVSRYIVWIESMMTRSGGAAEALWRSAARHLLDKAVPGAAGLAPPGPFRREGAALLAGVAGLRLGHARPGGAGSCGADLHLDRSFGAAMDKLIDERVVAAVDLARRALPNDAPLVQHRDAVGNPARADHVVSYRNRRRT